MTAMRNDHDGHELARRLAQAATGRSSSSWAFPVGPPFGLWALEVGQAAAPLGWSLGLDLGPVLFGHFFNFPNSLFI
jgi:hypothetical protein